MKTDLRDLPFGVEIEMANATRLEVAKAVQTIVGGTVYHEGGVYDAYIVTGTDGREWKIVRDSSIRANNSDEQTEMNSPVLRYGDMEMLQNVVRAMRTIAHARVNGSCGMHIHVDAGAFDGRSLSNLIQIVYAQEDVITHAFAVSDQRRAQWCKPTETGLVDAVKTRKPTTKDDLGTIWYGGVNAKASRSRSHYDESRYHGLNLHSTFYRGTVEFRYFESTLHAGEVKASIQFVLALCAFALNASTVRTSKKTFDPTYNHKYEFRTWMLRLGLIGDEFKTCRDHILHLLPGHADYK